jgi:micrococcal nuclease
MWGGVAGVMLFAVALVVLVVGISVATIFHDDPAADAREQQFGQCYNGGQNCVVDGNTIYVAGDRVEVAGVDAPQIQGARCPRERDRGIDTATRLAELLNRGRVTAGGTFRDSYGREVRSVWVNGEDVAQKMIGLGLARAYYGAKQGWCP